MPSASSVFAQRFEQERIVVDQQQAQPDGLADSSLSCDGAAGTAGDTGKFNDTVVPRPTALSMSISPLCRRATP